VIARESSTESSRKSHGFASRDPKTLPRSAQGANSPPQELSKVSTSPDPLNSKADAASNVNRYRPRRIPASQAQVRSTSLHGKLCRPC